MSSIIEINEEKTGYESQRYERVLKEWMPVQAVTTGYFIQKPGTAKIPKPRTTRFINQYSII